LGAEAERIRGGIARGSEACIVVNGAYERGQLTSLQCGLRAVPPEVEAVLFTLVDDPAVSVQTVAALTAGAAPLLRIPRYQGRRGHPLLIGSRLLPELLAPPETAAARDVVHLHLDEAEFVDTHDPGIVADVDDPEAYQRLTGTVA